MQLANQSPLSDPPHKVVILAPAPAQLLDVAGPAEVLAQAGHLRRTSLGDTAASAGAVLYDVRVHIVAGKGLGDTSAGVGLRSSVSEAELRANGSLDTLIVAGGEGARTRCAEPDIVDLVRTLAGRAERIIGVCTGAFLLAEAGLLHGRRVTTHWRWCAELARRHGDLKIDPEPIYVRDGNVWTSAGVTAGMDLTLALVEADHGHALALAVARELVLFLRRPGDQKQFSTVLAAQSAPSLRLGDLLAWMNENLHRTLSVPELAARACLSPRQFARAFRAETGVTPGRMVERLRVEAARRVLESGRMPLGIVASACGFQTEETMRRSFLRQVGVPPGDYRERFRRQSSATPTLQA
ncbi:GlxA family transcriptional regulator [Methylobacterium oryzisoli]|uniref:GlxA family transcriptional regulator n=1 Tax=Methylobacterium oryzisoli TaxID=3385502 RepID=UPI003891A179